MSEIILVIRDVQNSMFSPFDHEASPHVPLHPAYPAVKNICVVIIYMQVDYGDSSGATDRVAYGDIDKTRDLEAYI
jgi:hypothetical protein